MGRAVLKKSVESFGQLKKVVKFIDSLGYREIALKSDTEPAAITAFRHRVAEECRAEVTS